jgi:hypothetical protein
MGEIVQDTKSKALTNLEVELAKRAKAMTENIAVGGNSIIIQKNGTMKFPGGDERSTADMVILAYRYRNQYFPKPYRKGEFSPAECYAFGMSQSGMHPAESVEAPVHPDCDTCPMNQFGTALNGGKGKACQNQFLVAVMMADLTDSEEVFSIKASPTVVKALSSYVLNMVDMYQHPIKVVTRFSVDASGDYSRLKAEFVGANPLFAEHAEHFAAADKLLDAMPKPKTDASVSQQATAAEAPKRQARAAPTA